MRAGPPRGRGAEHLLVQLRGGDLRARVLGEVIEDPAGAVGALCPERGRVAVGRAAV
ncbi:hypothetical protein [Streptomyces virginiae]|uniref:hypothetical protein n=1 Tax=Streptomyces virginiae TaxID=1961 RepID=UPI0036FCF645